MIKLKYDDSAGRGRELATAMKDRLERERADEEAFKRQCARCARLLEEWEVRCHRCMR